MDSRDLIETWNAWADTWDTGAKGPNAEYLAFEELFPLTQSANGHVLALHDRGRPQSSVIYLDPDGGPFDGTVVADSLEKFMAAWCGLACPNIEKLQLFFSDSSASLSPETEFAKKWRETLGLL